MIRNPLSLLKYVFAISLGALLFPLAAEAVPDNQSPLSVGMELTNDFRKSHPTVITTAKTGTDINPARHDNVALVSHICLQSPANIAPSESSTKDMSCADPSNGQQRFSVQLGRRIGTDSEILGEFDGVRVDYRLSDRMKLNGIAGYPVITPEDMFNVDRQMFGISLVTDRLARTWDLSGYLIEKQENGQTNGKSMGGAIRHLQSGRSLVAYLDYDFNENSVGTAMASGAWKLPYKTTISATLDRRNRPISGHQQKFMQQSMSETEGWYWILPADRLKHYTGDACGEVSTLAIGVSHALSQRINLSSDIAMLKSMDDAGISPVTTAPPSEYSYHFRLDGKDLFMPGDRNKLDLKYNVTEAGRMSTAAFDTKYAINQFWNIMSNVRADYHRPALESSPRWIASPKVKMEYRQTKYSSFNLEAGGEWESGMNAVADNSRSSYFASLGYQAKF